METRNYFFSSSQNDRLRDLHIPTQNTFERLLQSIPFKTEPTDRAQLTLAGIVKTAKDKYINNRANDDVSGASPYGFTTVVRPSQIPKIVAGSNISLTQVVRTSGDTGETDSGNGVMDYLIAVSNAPVVDLADLELMNDQTLKTVIGAAPSYSVNSSVHPTGENFTTFLDALVANVGSNAEKLKELADYVNAQQRDLQIGDWVGTTLPKTSWGPKWLEANGDEVLIADYPDLYAVYLNSFGVASSGYFRLPDFRNKFLRAVGYTSGIPVVGGGQDTTNITISVGNMPAHQHGLTNAETVSSGSHRHGLPTNLQGAGGGLGGVIDPVLTPGLYQTDEGGVHKHALTGSTDSVGSGVPISVATVPSYKPTYVKILAK